MSGCLYSVGVGPGDPELMTLKAVKIIRNCQVLVLPAESKEKCVAYQIVRRAIPEIEDKTTVCLVMPMTKDKDRLEKSHREGTQKVAEVPCSRKDAAFLTLGDPTVYATSMYIHQRDCRDGVSTSIVSGVPSFVLQRQNLAFLLGEKQEQIHIILQVMMLKWRYSFPNQNPHESREKDAGCQTVRQRTSWMGCNGGKLRHGRRTSVDKCRRYAGTSGILYPCHCERSEG